MCLSDRDCTLKGTNDPGIEHQGRIQSAGIEVAMDRSVVGT